MRASGATAIEWYVGKAIERVGKGDLDSAREVIESFAALVGACPRAGWTGPIPYDLAKFLADAFSRIGKGAAPGRALGLESSKRGPKNKRATEAARQSLAAVFEIVRREGKMSEAQAMAALEQRGYSKRTIERARGEHPWMDSTEHYTITQLRDLLISRDAPKIALILGARKRR